MVKRKIFATILSFFLFCKPSFAETAEEYLNLGIKNFNDNKPELAEKNFNDALKINPKLLDAYIRLGRLYSNKKDIKAVGYFNKAIELKPDFFEAYNGLAQFYVDSDKSKAIDYYKKSLSINSNEDNYASGSIADIADQLFEEKNNESGLELYKYLIEKLPNSIEFTSRLAQFYIKSNNKKEYDFYLDLGLSRISEKDKTISGYLIQALVTLLENKKFDEAIAIYQKLIKKRPLDPQLYSELGLIYTKLHKFNESAKYYKKAVEFLPSNESTIYYMVLDLLEQIKSLEKDKKNYELIKEKLFRAENLTQNYCDLGSDDSEECYETKEKINGMWKKFKSSKPSAYDFLKLGLTNLEEKKLSQAEGYFKKAIKLNPKLAVAYSKLGNIYREKGNEKVALEYYNKSIKADPNFPDGYNNIGFIYSSKEQYEKAVVYFTKAYNLDKTTPLFKNNLIEAKEMIAEDFFKKDKNEQAIKTYTELIKLQENDNYYIKRAICYFTINKSDKADSDFKNALKISVYVEKVNYFIYLYYLEQIGKLKAKKYNIEEIKTKLKLAQKNLNEACKSRDQEFCDTELIKNLRDELNIPKTNEELDEIEKYFILGKEQAEKKDYENAIKNLKINFYLSDKNKEKAQFLAKLMVDYAVELSKQGKKEESKQIIDESGKISISSRSMDELQLFAFMFKVDELLQKKQYDTIIENLENAKNGGDKELQVLIDELLLKAYMGKLVKLNDERPIQMDKYKDNLVKFEKIYSRNTYTPEQVDVFKKVVMSGKLLLDIAERNNYISDISNSSEGKKDSELEKEFIALIAKEPKNYVAYSELGLVKGKLGKFDEGIELIKKALELNGKDADSYYNLALIYNMKKETPLVIENLKKSFEINPIFKEIVKDRIYNKKDPDFANIKNVKEFKVIFD